MEQLRLFKYLPSEIEENEFILFDRLEKIKTIISQYGEENFCFSFSGGKDSTVLHYLLDMALPDNKIPRIFSQTGLEFRLIHRFVKTFADKDNRFHIVSPRKNIVKTLKKVGYPFKSKEHSQRIYQFWHAKKRKSIMPYFYPTWKTKYKCPKILMYQTKPGFNFKISDKCCTIFKKRALTQWQKDNGKTVAITGMRIQEGGCRASMTCTSFNNGGALTRFHPLAPITESWLEWFIDRENIKLCELYYPPYNFERTGCVGCPYAIDIEKELRTLKRLLPGEYKRACLYFGPVYDEYKRIGYRITREV